MSPKRVFGRGRTDAALINESLLRPEAFEGIFERHFEAVQRYLARRVGGGLADDVASATFVVAFERRRAFHDAAGSARPWLFGIATNLVRNELRGEQRALGALARVASDASRGGSDDSANVLPDLASALAALDVEQRDVLLLFAWEELSYREIAAALGLPVGTVRSRLARARARLRAGLDGERAAERLKAEHQEVTE